MVSVSWKKHTLMASKTPQKYNAKNVPKTNLWFPLGSLKTPIKGSKMVLNLLLLFLKVHCCDFFVLRWSSKHWYLVDTLLCQPHLYPRGVNRVFFLQIMRIQRGHKSPVRAKSTLQILWESWKNLSPCSHLKISIIHCCHCQTKYFLKLCIKSPKKGFSKFWKGNNTV